MKTRILTAIVLSLIFTAASHAADVSSFLTNSGNWSNSGIWSNIPFTVNSPNNGNGGFTYDATVSGSARTATLGQNITIQDLNLISGTINGSFDLTENALFTWEAGSLAGSGTNFANGGLAVSGGASLDECTLVPAVSSTLANGYISFLGGGTLSNTTGVVFDILDDSSLLGNWNSGGGFFVNLGVLEKTGAGNDISGAGTNISDITANLTNYSVVFANDGTLQLFSGYSNGSLTTAPSAYIEFLSSPSPTPNFTLNGGTLSGGGTVAFAGGAILLVNTVNAPGVNILLDGGAVGSIGGSGNMVNSGPFLWTSGELTGSGTNFVNGPLAINGGVTLVRTLIPTASSTLTNGYIIINGGGVISNATGAVFDILDDSSLFANENTEGGIFLNAGVLEKTGAGNDVSGQGTNISLVSVVFTNSGSVVAQKGTLKFTGGYFQTGGATEVNGGTITSTTVMNIKGGSVIGNGTIVGTVLNKGTVSAGLSGSGSLTIAGTLTNEAGATLLVELGGYTPGIGYGFLTVTNTAFLAGNLAVSFSNNYSFISTVTNGASFIVATCGTNFAGSFTNVASGGTLATTDGFAQFTVTYAGSTSLILGNLRILDTVGDGIPNWWRAQYFGGTGGTTNGSSCATCDADGTGQDNLFKYVAGLDPIDPTSVFVLLVQSVTGQPSQENLLFNPEVTGRTYTPQFSTNLVSGSWTNLTGFSGPTTNIDQVTVTDMSATQTQKFYRIDISLP
jgi:hypothetical protein